MILNFKLTNAYFHLTFKLALNNFNSSQVNVFPYFSFSGNSSFLLALIFIYMQNATSILGSKQSRIILVLSLITLAFWYWENSIKVYQFAIVDAIFEILWLPMIALVFVLPVLSLFFWTKEKWSVKSLYLYYFLMGFLTVVFLINNYT